MRQWFLVVLSLLMIAGSGTVLAQGGATAAEGDPPIAALIAISQPDDAGNVTITGAPGAVFPGAQVAVRNLYTGDVVYTAAGITGAFTVPLYGPGNTPFHISPASTIPAERRNQPGSLPGGPGTIIYGQFPESRPPQAVPTTRLVVDGSSSDWASYPNSISGDTFTLRNTDSLFIGVENAPAEFASVRVRLASGSAEVTVTVAPGVYETGLLEEIAPAQRDPVTIAAVAESADVIEIRIPAGPLADLAAVDVETLTLAQVAYVDADANVLEAVDLFDDPIPAVIEQDGIFYPNSAVGNDFTRFSISGSVAQGVSVWQARGRIATVDVEPGGTLQMELDVTLNAPALPETLTGLSLIGEVGLLPVADADGVPVSGALYGSNGWSTLLTRGGLPIENLNANLLLGEVVIPPSQVIRRGDSLLGGFAVTLPLPDDLPAGTYVPYFRGLGQIGDGERFTWAENGLLGTGERSSAVAAQRLPIVLNAGVDAQAPRRMIWTLFHDESGNGSRGLVANEDQNIVAISNRVKFNSPTYILPPATRYDDATVTYSIEPSIINMLSNDYNLSTAPLLPLLFPNGRMEATITRPDGSTDGFAATPIVQNSVSTAELDEQSQFGAHSQVDIYRVTTLNDLYTAQTFDLYGDYTIELNGFVEDVQGNRYEGGGTYNFTIAETLAMSPAMLSGTSLQAGNSINRGLHVSPGVPADVTVNIRVFPIKGDQVLEQTIEGQANAYGVFQPDTPFLLEVAGEYVIDYEARYTDSDGRLWAGSLRSAGVIGQPGNRTVARGQRGAANANIQTAWFLAEDAADVDSQETILNMPYFSGDVAWITDSPLAGLLPRMRVQDTTGAYEQWLQNTHADYTDSDETPLSRLQATDALPVSVFGGASDADNRVLYDPNTIASEGYAYISLVTPGAAVRQFVPGSEAGSIPMQWRLDDPLNQQIGAGAEGLSAGDYVFMFGGTILKNEPADLNDAAIYGTLGVIIDAEDDSGARVLPPYMGADTAPGNSTLFVDNEAEIFNFFYPTGTRPGDVLAVGDVLAISGQVAPMLASNVAVQVTSPSGQVRAFDGTANPVGYFYVPVNDFTVDEPGVWTVQVDVQHTGPTWAGEMISESPIGTVPGAANSTYNVYVVPDADSVIDRPSNLPDNDRIPPGFPFNFSFNRPEGWTEVTPYLTVTLPGRVVQDGPVALQGATFAYQFNPTVLNQQFPFYEGNNGRVSGEASSDPLTLTFVFTGLDENGTPDILARRVVIRHDRLITLD